MNRYKIRQYFTFEELLAFLESKEKLHTPIDNLKQFASTSKTIFGYQEFNPKFNDVFDMLCNDYLTHYTCYKDYYVPFWAIKDIPEGIDEEQVTRFVRKLITIYNKSSDRYLALLDIYEAQKSHLMDKLQASTDITEKGNNDSTTTRTDNLKNSTTSVHRVNDTPQNGGSWADDNHTSLYEETTNNGSNTGTQGTVVSGTNGRTINTSTATDPMTIMARINEIQDNYMNVLKNWGREFNNIFIYKGEYDYE